MFGDFKIKISSRKLIYDFVVHRKVTVITGESAIGKSKLYNLLYSYNTSKYSIIQVECKYECKVCEEVEFNYLKELYSELSSKYPNHKSEEYYREVRELFKKWDNFVFFVDEDSDDFICSEFFAVFCKYTDSFFVLITREPLEYIPYSYTDSYFMRENGKYHWLERCYEGSN